MSKIKLYLLAICLITFFTNAQVTPVAGDYKIINIGNNSVGDFAKNLILIHEIYNGTFIQLNSAVGTITALRGTNDASNRINILEINSSSAYNSTSVTTKSFDDNGSWALKTCIYNGKKYLAVAVPYSPAYHSWGFKFAGWTKSTGENMKTVNYEVNGTPVNTSILSNIQDYTANMDETHNVKNFLVMGNNVGIGTINPDEKLTVKGKIHAQEIKVTLNAGTVPDYVFADDYKLKSLTDVEEYIKQNSHLPEIPSAKEIEQNGLMLAEMNMSLLKKIEELTLYLIEMKKELTAQNNKIKNLENDRI
jgi:hypothetical protein